MKRQTRLILAAGICIVACCVGIWFLLTSDPILPKIATPVTRTADWYLSTYGEYYWLNSEEVMFFRLQGRVWTAYRRNVRTGAESAMTEFSSRFKASGGDANYVVDVAPDGQHIFWWVNVGPGAYLCLCRTDGSGFHRLKDTAECEFYWLSDSRHILRYCPPMEPTETGKSCVIDITNINDPRCRRPVPIHKYAPITQTGLNLGNMGQGNLLVISETRILASNLNSDIQTVKLYDFGLGDKPQSAKPHTVKLPDKTAWQDCLNVLFSPKGDRIAWLLRTQRVSPLKAMLHKVWPKYQANPQSVISLRISRTDGSGMHEIGYFPRETPKPDNSEWLSAYHLAWLPDNQRLSFLDHDRLYTLRAN